MRPTVIELCRHADGKNLKDAITAVGITAIVTLLPFVITAIVLRLFKQHLSLGMFTEGGDLAILAPGFIIPAVILLARDRPVANGSGPLPWIAAFLAVVVAIIIYLCATVSSHKLLLPTLQMDTSLVTGASVVLFLFSLGFTTILQLTDEVRTTANPPSVAANKRLRKLQQAVDNGNENA